MVTVLSPPPTIKAFTTSHPFTCSCPHEVRDKKPSLTLNLGTDGLKVTSEPPPMAGPADCSQGQDRSDDDNFYLV
ncbi:hypothetical protein J6590_086947 [Homalodisca vitripennis]|nr:hypothetical protein J6590_086947 [Homalodisca vitripennis]